MEITGVDRNAAREEKQMPREACEGWVQDENIDITPKSRPENAKSVSMIVMVAYLRPVK